MRLHGPGKEQPEHGGDYMAEEILPPANHVLHAIYGFFAAKFRICSPFR